MERPSTEWDRLQRELDELRAWRYVALERIAAASAQLRDLERRMDQIEDSEPEVLAERVAGLASALTWLRGAFWALLLMLLSLLATLGVRGRL